MTDHAPDRIWSGIDIPKTIAGVLAAVTAAVLGSFLGVAGTIAGAALAAFFGSVGTELYHRFINRGSKRLKSTFVTAPAAVGTPAVAAAEEEVPSAEEPEPAQPRTTRMRWGRVAAVAAAVFVLAMGALTAFELLTKQTVADAVGGSSGGRTTTVGNVLSGNEQRTEEPATTPSDTPTEDPGAEPTDGPTETTEPTAPATTEEPAPAETEEPADPGSTEAPAPAEDPERQDTGRQDTGRQDTGQPGAVEQPDGQG